MNNQNTAGPGRPKTLAGDLKAFNTKLQEDHRAQLDAIIKVGPFSSYRDMLEAWTDLYFKVNPDMQEKVNTYLDLTKG